MQEQLHELLQRSGSPSYVAVVRHAEIERHRLSKSSVSNVLKGRGKPRLETVEAFVVGCTAYAKKQKLRLPSGLTDLVVWRALYAETYPDLPDAVDQLIPDALRATYLARLAARYDRLEFQALLAAGVTDATEPAPDRILVPPRIRAALPTVELPREARQRLAEGSPLTNLPTGLDADLVRQAHRAYESQPARPALEMLVDPGEQRVVLLGDPGSGKSVTVRHLTTLLCRGETASWGPALDSWLPLFVELRMFAAPPWRTGTFVDLLDHLYRTEGLGLPADTLETYLRQDGRAVVVFDGLDEIFDPDLRQTVARQIAGFAFHYPRTRIVVTSRPVEYQRRTLEAAGFSHYVVQDFNRNEVAKFAHGWYRARMPDAHAAADRQAADHARRRLMSAYDNSLPVRELSGNPLLLTILAMVNERYAVPRHRLTVYEHALAVLVDQWDVDKHLRKDPLVRLDREGKMDLLRAVARTTLRDGGLAGNYISGESLLGEVESYLRTRCEVPTYQARPAAQAIVEEFRERTFIISRFGGNVYGFVHRSFLEYFTAADLVEHLTLETLDDLYRQNWSSPEWHEVLVLVSGMILESAAGLAIDRLLSADPMWQFRDEHDPQHVLLALRCLGEVRDPDLLPEQGVRLTRALVATVEAAHRQEIAAHDDSLARALLHIAPPVLEVLGSKWSGPPVYEWWYRTSGRFLATSPAVIPAVFTAATRLCAAVSRGVDDVREILAAEATVSLDPLVRLAAVAGLAAGWPDHPATVRTVRQSAVVDLDKDVRREALRTLVDRWPNDQRSWTLLRQRCIEDPNRAVRLGALRAATAMWADTEWSGDIARFLQDRSKDPDHAVREAAMLGLVRHARGAPAAHNLILEYAKDDSDAGVRRAALRSLAQGWNDYPGTLKAVLHRIDADGDPGVRITGIAALIRHWSDDPQARPVVERAATADPHWSVRHAAMRALAAQWPGHHTSLRAIRRLAVRDPVAPNRAVALQTLAARWPSDESVSGLLFSRGSKDDDWTVRRAAWEALAAVRPHDTRTWTGIRNAINDDPANQLRAAIVHLPAHIRPNDVPARSVVIRAAQDPDSLVRSAAVQALGTDWSGHPEARAALAELAERDDDHRVRRAALTTAGIPAELLRERLGADPHPTVRKAALLALAGDPDEQSRLLAAVATADPDPELRALAVRTLPDPAADDPHPLVRAAAVATCNRLPTVHRLATTDADADVRRVALRALTTGWPSDPDTRAAVRAAATTDADAACRRTGLQLLTVAWPDDPDTVTVVSDRAADDPAPGVRRTALQLLATDLWGVASVAELIRDVAVQDRDAEVRRAALAVCLARWPLEPATLAVLHERLGADPDDDVREFAVRALAGRYPKHPRTADLLRRRLTGDSSGAVRDAAQSLIHGTEPPLHWSVSVETYGRGVAVLSVAGEIDMATAAHLQEQLSEVIEAGLIHLVLDMSEVTFLDSPGLSVLVRGMNWLVDTGGEVSVVAHSRAVIRPLEVSGLVEVLNCRPTVAEALEQYHLPEQGHRSTSARLPSS